MIKPIFIYGPQRCGKTVNREIFAKFFNKSNIIDGFEIHAREFKDMDSDSIAFYHEKIPNRIRDRCVVLSYDDAVSILQGNGVNVVKFN